MDDHLLKQGRLRVTALEEHFKSLILLTSKRRCQGDSRENSREGCEGFPAVSLQHPRAGDLPASSSLLLPFHPQPHPCTQLSPSPYCDSS
jgi:hypothetical protein